MQCVNFLTPRPIVLLPHVSSQEILFELSASLSVFRHKTYNCERAWPSGDY
jgi:hypothetical protein